MLRPCRKLVRSEVEAGSTPAAFHTAVREVTDRTLREGLSGWPVSDAAVTVTHCDHRPPPVPVGGFRDLTPLVAMAALQQAGTAVCEPVHRFTLELPTAHVGALLGLLSRLGVAPDPPTTLGSWSTVEGEIRAARLHRLQVELPAISGGEGVLETAFAAYRPVRGRRPTRPRTDRNPLDRAEYLLRVAQRR